MMASEHQANAGAGGTPLAGKGNSRTFKFIMPIRHPGNVRDKGAQQRYLAQTLASLDAQTDRNFEILIAANEGQQLPRLPERARVAHVDFPRNDAIDAAGDGEAVREAIKIDKGNRVRAAFAFVDADDCVMVVDDDDFVSCHLVERHRQLDQSKGWYINLGYLWRDGSPFLTRTDSFYELCGTSLIVPASFYAYFSAPGIGETDVARELGSHKLIFDRRPIAGGSFRPFPLRAAIYRLGHSNATQADLDRARKAQSERQGAGRRRIVPAVRRRLRTARDLVFGRALKVELSGKVRSEFFGALA